MDEEHLLHLAKQEPWELIDRASRLRYARFGRQVRLCSIVPGKLGGCEGNCRWCAQASVADSGHDTPRHTSREEIIAAARDAADLGSSAIGIVNSGLAPTAADLAAVIAAAEDVAREGRIRICASLGSLSDVQAVALANSAVTRYHHNLETSRRFLPSVTTSSDYDRKLETLRRAKAAGLAICCGGLFGLGETWADRLDLARTLRDGVGPDIVPLNFLSPIPGTPLADRPVLPPVEILAIIAMFRLILPEADIKIAGGRSNLRDLQSWMFHAGATSCMIGNYLTTTGRSVEDDQRMLSDLGLEVVRELGVVSVIV